MRVAIRLGYVDRAALEPHKNDVSPADVMLVELGLLDEERATSVSRACMDRRIVCPACFMLFADGAQRSCAKCNFVLPTPTAHKTTRRGSQGAGKRRT